MTGRLFRTVEPPARSGDEAAGIHRQDHETDARWKQGAGQ
jgi:hypothetical protein